MAPIGEPIDLFRPFRETFERSPLPPLPKHVLTPSVFESPPPQAKVFLVHGHDQGVLAEVSAFVMKAKWKPIIMKDASSPTENLLDELIKHTKGVRFAIVIITADDIGRAKGQPEEQSRYRGRQNVIFEFGYLIHQLSKSKVFVLHGQDVELPSDYSGIIYIPYDQPGAWQLQLAKAIKNASIPGIAVNLNSLFR